MVRRISSSRACVITMIVTSSGISFCSMRSRTVWKSVSDADGNPTSISLRPTAHSVLNSRFLVSRLMGSNSAWLPSRRSVLHHTGTCRELARRPLPVGQVDGRERDGTSSMDLSTWRITRRHGSKRRTRLPRVSAGSSGFQSCMRRLVARVYVRLGRKKEERTQQRGCRGAALRGVTHLLVAIHARHATTDASARSIFQGLTPSGARGPVFRRCAAATVRPSLPPLPTHDPARLSRRLAIQPRDATIDQPMRYARRELQRFLERRVILDRRGIQHEDVREMIVSRVARTNVRRRSHLTFKPRDIYAPRNAVFSPAYLSRKSR